MYMNYGNVSHKYGQKHTESMFIFSQNRFICNFWNAQDVFKVLLSNLKNSQCMLDDYH